MKISMKIFVVLLAGLSLLIFTACGSDDDPTPTPSTGTITGSVTDADTGTLLSGVLVSSGSVSDTTGSDGIYTLSSIEVGNQPITATLDGYQTYTGNVTVTQEVTSTENIQLIPSVTSGTWQQTDGPAGCLYQYQIGASQSERCQVQPEGQEGCQITNLTIDPTDPTILYAGTFCNGVYKSTDGGVNWNEYNTGLPLGLDTYILSMDPLNSDTLFVGTVGAGIYKSMNGGDSWNSINTGITNLRVHNAPAIDPENPSILYTGTEGQVFKSTDGGANWTVSNNGLGNNEVGGLAIDPSNSSTIYAGLHYDEGWNDGGVFKSTDGGQNWSPINNGLPDPATPESSGGVLTIDPTNNQTVYSATDGGVFKTIDGGQNWSPINTGLTNLSARFMTIHPSNSEIIYVGTWGGGVFWSTNGGTNWQPVNTGLTNSNVLGLVLDPSNPSLLYAGTFGDGVFKIVLP